MTPELGPLAGSADRFLGDGSGLDVGGAMLPSLPPLA